MQISNSVSTTGLYARYTVERFEKSAKVSQSESYTDSMRMQSFQYSRVTFEIQGATAETTFEKNYEAFQNFLEEIGYDGRPIGELSREEAETLVAEDGFFGVAKTAERIANFVLEGAGDDEGLLRAGREGILQGFKEAEEIWGGKLPDISYETIDKAVEMIDMAMHEMGFAIVSTEA
jgi:hypothetical protein